MAKKGKPKISKIKRNNQTTNKMKKQGTLKLQRHRQKVQKQKQPPSRPQVEYSSDSDAASGDEWADMLDEEEQKYIMTRIANQPQLLSNVPEKDPDESKAGKKRKREPKVRANRATAIDSGAETDSEASGSDFEDKYEREMDERPPKKMRPLLPIKTKEGVIERSEECEGSDSDEEVKTKYKKQPLEKVGEASDDEEESDSGLERGEEESPDTGEKDPEVVTAVELLAARRDRLAHDKLRIGALCSSLLENPEKKLKNLYPILYLMEERLKDGTLNLHSIRKLATLSAYEVFKDILPDYYIRHQDYSNVKLKKDTLALYKYEKELLEFYKRYLQRLEKCVNVLRRKKGDTRRIDDSSKSLALISLQCMCGMLESRSQFNFAPNIAQSVIPLLDCWLPEARELVAGACTEVFKEDRKGDATLMIVRLINQLVKRRGLRLQPAALDCLLSLHIRDVDLDTEAELKHKQKQDEKHKKRIVNLSKKEKKRAKKLKEVERELLETEAQENELARKKQLTEIIKTVFQIYFRILKTAPESKLLAAALDGIAKFTHVINLDYYSDLVSQLGALLQQRALPARERLQCARTVLRVLAGAGDALNVDPAKFHEHLYADSLTVHAGASHSDAPLILESISEVCARARRVPPQVLLALAKRMLTLSLNLQHNGALACLLLVHKLAQQSKAVSGLLDDTPEPLGSGRFDPTLSSPAHCDARPPCDAAAARAHELVTLARHYHGGVRGAAGGVAHGKMPVELSKMSPTQIFKVYDGSTMGFKPSIPPPKPATPTNKKLAHTWAQPEFRQLCEDIENRVELVIK